MCLIFEFSDDIQTCAIIEGRNMYFFRRVNRDCAASFALSLSNFSCFRFVQQAAGGPFGRGTLADGHAPMAHAHDGKRRAGSREQCGIYSVIILDTETHSPTAGSSIATNRMDNNAI